MAVFNNGYPMTYPQYYPQGFPQYQQMNQSYQQTQQNQQGQTPQIQNGGFVPVRNIEEARNYHIAPGTSVTFIDENAPYVYTKTRGFSQLEPPVFEKLRLVKEEDKPVADSNGSLDKTIEYALKSDLMAIQEAQDALKKELDELKKDLGGDDDD